MCQQARHHLWALVVANKPRTIVRLVHVPVGWRPCLVSLLDVPVGLEPPSGLLAGANKLRAVPPDFSMVGGFGLFRITGQAGLGLNRP